MVSQDPQTKTGQDLIDEIPDDASFDGMDGGFAGGPVATPFDKAFQALTQTEGDILQMMTRTNPPLAIALSKAYNRVANYNSAYIYGQSNLLMRISVSNGGEGRSEIVAALKAGVGVPGEFYDSQPMDFGGGKPGKRTFSVIPDGEDEENAND